jgi:hypothetical protein
MKVIESRSAYKYARGTFGEGDEGGVAHLVRVRGRASGTS